MRRGFWPKQGPEGASPGAIPRASSGASRAALRASLGLSDAPTVLVVGGGDGVGGIAAVAEGVVRGVAEGGAPRQVTGGG